MIHINKIKLFIIISLGALLWPKVVESQVKVVPFAGINSTRVKYFDFLKGGNYILVGVEVEGRLRPRKISPYHVSLVTGISFLSNGFFRDSGIAVPGLVFNAGTSELKTRYLRFPIEVKFNWRPFPLIEDWELFLGVGISNDILLKSELIEHETRVSTGIGVLTSPPQTTSYEDKKMITEYGKKYAIFQRLEIGTRFNRIQLAYRFSYSLTDMHHSGLENVWDVPAQSSTYFSPVEINGTRKERYFEFVIGVVIY